MERIREQKIGSQRHITERRIERDRQTERRRDRQMGAREREDERENKRDEMHLKNKTKQKLLLFKSSQNTKSAK